MSGSGDGMISIESVILCGESKPWAGNPGVGSLIPNLGYSLFPSSRSLKEAIVLFAIFDHRILELFSANLHIPRIGGSWLVYRVGILIGKRVHYRLKLG